MKKNETHWALTQQGITRYKYGKILFHCNLRRNNIIHFMITGQYCNPSPRGDVMIRTTKQSVTHVNLGINKDLK